MCASLFTKEETTMNVSLTEWNKLLAEAKDICEDLNRKGCSVKMTPYTMYTGHKGITFKVLDQQGEPFQSFVFGAGTADEIRTTMRKISYRILRECGVN